MNTRIALHGLIAVSIAWATLACAKDAASASEKSTADPASAAPAATDASAKSDDWTANGATACEKYLTPDVVAGILKAPAGHSRRIDAQSCYFDGARGAGGIGINLKVADVDAFRQMVPRIVGTNNLPGVGDAAYWNAAGAVSAVKGHTRGCDISEIGGVTTVSGAALGQKLGEICNKLFALP
jgi:hypothetical protein